ncbi:AGR266Cp [Eremothecium gossypii ATCC 10895]|uniref:AGR266Cp n=1 Tax=Eremothecium gossypii (strain ATCC 10895 / CBS 109.51 / FGSC 9923 / NRRL Y-1056) TaxID=284811 RepID=Q74ZD3_EREGS|nr:AGR266Cp [Eremothecium gossypii ATCC 10895]AAS54756.1 AGR266Cp [Eremothecium gossypii ATCC 10895]
MSQFVRTVHSRVGREKQRYSALTGARLVAGCVALNEDKTKVIMIQSLAQGSNGNKWVLPKGGVELDEPDFRDSARRETWEEAGVVGEIVRYLGVIEDMRPPKNWSAGGAVHPPRSEFHFYEMRVQELADEYPEKHKRQRHWFTYSEAKTQLQLAKRPELLEALDRSAIVKYL